MRRRNVPASWFRRMTLPIREFLRVDLSMTEQALRLAHPAAQQLLCAPPRFLLWLLDELERSAADLRSLLPLRRDPD
jgi:hypothetical protein